MVIFLSICKKSRKFATENEPQDQSSTILKQPRILLLTALLTIAMTLGFVGCKSKPEPTPPPTAQRTILVYMVASNNLGSNGYDAADLHEMQQGMQCRPAGRLLVYHAPAQGTPVLKEITTRGTDTLLKYDNQMLSVDSRRMSQVLDDVRRLAPALSYGLVLWSHGSGWLQDGITDDAQAAKSGQSDTPHPASWGYDRGRTMNITTLAATLGGRQLDFIYFDCCYMNGIEVAYQLRRVTPTIVGSVAELPVEGMPYDQNVPCLFADPPALVQAAANTFKLYDSRRGDERTCTMSVINTSGLDRLAQLTRQIYSAAPAGLPPNYDPQSFKLDGRWHHCDLEHYVRALAATQSDPTLFGRWQEALNDCIAYRAATPKLWDYLPIETHCGLSTYIITNPSMVNYKNYQTLEWYSDVVSAIHY